MDQASCVGWQHTVDW